MLKVAAFATTGTIVARLSAANATRIRYFIGNPLSKSDGIVRLQQIDLRIGHPKYYEL